MLAGVLGLSAAVGCAPDPAEVTSFAVTAPVGSTQETAGSGGASGSTTGSTSGDSGAPGSTSSSGVSTGGMRWDLGTPPDIGPTTPPGCKGKVDFLFAISRDASMKDSQAQLVASFKPFIDSIQALGDDFADFDFHIMVVDADDYWGQPQCAESCMQDGVCKYAKDYPCDYVPSACDATLGAGTIYNAGDDSFNKSCGLAAGKRFLDTTTWDLEKTFACVAQVGTDGWEQDLGGAIDAAVTTQRDACNKGFLRDDALLVITYVKQLEVNSLEGYPVQWMLRIVDAKGGDPNSVVMLGISQWSDLASCLEDEDDWLCDLLVMFPHHAYEYAGAASYGPAFEKTVGLIDDACAQFVPG